MAVVMNTVYNGARLLQGEDAEVKLAWVTLNTGVCAVGDIITLTNGRGVIYAGSSVTDDTSAASASTKVFGVAMAAGDATDVLGPARIPVVPIRLDTMFRMLTGDSTAFTAAKMGAVCAIGGAATNTHRVLLGRTGLTTDLLGPVRIMDVILPTIGQAQGNGLQYAELTGAASLNKDAATRLAALTSPSRVEVVVKFNPGVLQY